MQAEKILVLLVHYNTPELIPDVLLSIKEDKVTVEILIVDNGSSLESYNCLKQINDPRVTIIRNKENLGFAGGNNYGLQYAINRWAEIQYVFLLNTDAYCCPNLLYELKEILDKNPDAASVTPRIIRKDNRPWYEGAMLDYKKGKVTSRIYINQENRKSHYEVDVFSGCAVLFKLNMLLQVGMLNEKLFLYYEEADLSIKLHKLGYMNLYTPNLTLTHDVSYSTRKVSFLKTYYMTRNKFIVFNDYMSWQSKFNFLIYELAFYLKHKRFKNAFYVLKGYIDFKKGRSGKLQTAICLLFLFEILQESAYCLLQ